MHDELAPGAVVTPEGVRLEFQLAGIASRALSATIDAIIQTVLMIGALIISAAVSAGSDLIGLVFMLFSIILVLFGYPVAMEVLNNGRTVGRTVMGTRVVTIDGAPVGFRHALVRALLAIVDHLLTFGGVAMLCALLTRRGQRLGDLAAGTMVVRERSAAQVAERVWYRTAVNPVTINASRMDPALFQEIRAWLLREDDLAEPARDALGERLERLTHHATGMARPQGISRSAWLSSVAAAASGQLHAMPPPGVRVVGQTVVAPGAAPPPPIAGTGLSSQRPPAPT